jgi:hypothetical protein
MYSLVSAPVLGFDLSRLQGGPAVADILLRALALTQSDLSPIAATRTDDWERAALWQDVDAAAQERRKAGEQAKSLAVIERSPLGTLDGLLHCVRYDILDWTWGNNKPGAKPTQKNEPVHPTPATRVPRQRQTPTASRATAVISDAAAAAYLRELLPEDSHRKLVLPWTEAVGSLGEPQHDLGPQAEDVERLLARVAAVTDVERDRLVRVSDNARPGLADWAPAVHSASWAIFLSGRVRAAAAAQLRLVQAIDLAGFSVGDRAGGVWNLLSGAIQALMVRDLLDSPTSRRLLDAYFTAMGPFAG